MSSELKQQETEKPQRSDSLGSRSAVKVEYPDHSTYRPKKEESKHIHEKAVAAFYNGLWSFICTVCKVLWNYFTFPVGKTLWSTINKPLYPIYMLPYEMVCYPIREVGGAILKDVTSLEPTGPFKDLVNWYRSHRTKSFTGISIFATLASLALSFILAQTLLLSEIDFSIVNPTTPKVSFVANLINIDSTLRTFTIDWYPQPVLPFPQCQNETELVANIYFDQNLLDNSSPSMIAGSDEASTPDNPSASTAPSNSITFQYNSTEACSPTFEDSTATFRTISKLADLANNRKGRSTLQAYPIDKYIAQVSFFAVDNSTGETVPLDIALTWGTVVNFKAVLDRSSSGSSARAEGIYLLFYVSRSEAVKLFVYCVIAANWIVTASFLWLSIACLLWHNERIIKEMFVLPVTALFAFTTVRANLPGAPAGFGAYIDFVGILPNLVLITFSSAALLTTVLVRRVLSEIRAKKEAEKGELDNKDVSMLITVLARRIMKEIPMEEVRNLKKTGSEGGDSENEEEYDDRRDYFVMTPKKRDNSSGGKVEQPKGFQRGSSFNGRPTHHRSMTNQSALSGVTIEVP